MPVENSLIVPLRTVTFDVPAGAYADAVELRLRPGLRAHARAGDGAAAEVERHVIGVDHERVPVALEVVRQHEVRGDPLTALRALRRRR